MDRNYQILVVEEDDILRRFCEQVLLQLGYRVTVASSGEEALVEVASEKFHLILTDYRMSGMDGVNLARLIKATSPETPIVLHTGGPRFASNPPNVDRVIYKPTPMGEFAKLIQLIEK